MTDKALTAVWILMTGTVLAAPVPGFHKAVVGPQAQELLAKVALLKGVCVVLGLPQAGQSKLVYRSGKHTIELIETVTERKLPDEFNGTYEWSGGRNTLRNRFIELGPNRTRWESTCTYQFSSFLLKLMGFVCPGVFRKQNLRFLQNFKAFAEEWNHANAGSAV